MSHSRAETMRDLTTSAHEAGGGMSFSQLGEDRMLWWMFEQCRNGFYVDIGCHQPHRFSNTALPHLANRWRGINVDVGERSIAAFREARPDDINVCAAIGGEASRLEVTMFQGKLNTFDLTMAANRACANLIDFLNVDIEGPDHTALMSNDWDNFMPEAAAVEVHGFDAADPAGSPTSRLLRSKGYRLLAHLIVTSIYRRDLG